MLSKLLNLVLFFLPIFLISQENKVLMSEEVNYNRGIDYFDMTLYADANAVLGSWIELPDIHPFGDYEKLRREAQLTAQIANLRIEDPSAETKLIYYIKEYYPDPVTIQPILELASHYYYQRNYQAAIDWYEKVDLNNLPEIDQSEAMFKKGYCYFVKKEFDKAYDSFKNIKDFQNIFYYPSNYYYGMSQYFKNDYVSAVVSFKKVGNSEYYGDFIPYYLSQIYFAQKEFDLLISYSEKKITEPSVKNKKNIRLLLGQAYYLRGDYTRALSHLEFYEANTDKLTIEEFYQLAFTQYKLGQYEKAKENFQELTYQESKIGQVSNYYLADCYIKLGDKSSARSIFKKVSQMNFDKGMQEEAMFNFGKISAEQGFEREAVNIFIDIPVSSPYHAESQDVIHDILVNSGDYLNSIKIMESLPRLNEKLKSTYQNLTLKKAIQFYSEDQFENAKIYFDKSLIYPIERLYLAQTNYWLSKMHYKEGDLNQALSYLEEYHKVANGLNDLPEESANYMANYLQAYIYLKEKNYEKAEVHFKNAIVGLNINNQDIRSEYILNRVLPDALIRAGDCLFKQSKYKNARSFYDQSITRKQPGFVYAMYQKALIDGLMGEPYEKIVTLEKITSEHPNDEYADDAYYQMGETYLTLGSMEPAAISFIDLMAKHGPSSPYYGQAQLKMGLINYNKGDLNKALTYYKSVFNYNPTSTQKVEAMKAIEEIYVKDLRESKKYFSFVDSIPGFELSDFSKDSVTYHIAFDQYNSANYENALISFNDYNKRYINGFYKVEAHYYRAEIYSIQKDFANALADYEYVIDFPKHEFYAPSLIKGAIIAYNDANDYTKALKYYAAYEKVATNETEKYKAQIGALKSAFRLSKDEMIIDFANKVNTNGLATTSERATALYYLGKVGFRNKEYDQAQAAFSQVSKMVNNNQAAESKYLLSEIYYRNGDLDLAEKQCNFNNETSLNYPYWVAKSIILLSDIYYDKEDLINARAALEAVIENFKDDETLQSEALEKLKRVENKEEEVNRIKITNPDVLELDSIGGK